MKHGEIRIHGRLKVALYITFALQLSLSANGAPSPQATRNFRMCTSPPCVHSASEILTWIDSTVNPCDDFFEFACGNYNGIEVMQSSYSFWNQFRYTQQHVDAASKEILSHPKLLRDPIALNKSKDVYAACMDTGKINEKGVAPLLQLLERFGGWPVLSRGIANINCGCGYRFSWTKIARASSQVGVPMVFDVAVRPNFYNASELVIYIQYDSLTTPVPLISPGQVELMEDFSWDITTDSPERKVPYDSHPSVEPQPADSDNLYVQFLSKLVRTIWNSMSPSDLNGFPEEDQIEEMVRSELRMVTSFMSKLKKVINTPSPNTNDWEKRHPRSDTRTVSGVMSIKTLQNFTDTMLTESVYKMNWLKYLQNLFANSGVTLTPEDNLYVDDLDKILNVLKLVDNTEERTLENFIGSRMSSFLAPETTDDLWKTAKWFYEELKYILDDYPRWMHCNHVVSDYPNIGLSMAVAYEFRRSYFEEGKLAQAEEMITDLQTAFAELLKENDWMDESTKAYALEKANYMLRLIGFPEWLSDEERLDAFYEKLSTSSDDHFGNVLRLRSFVFAKRFEGLRKKRERNEWSQSPLTVNAFYNTLNNRITFPAGVMNRPFFAGEDVEALDYGRIGSIIGHEITHGFDSRGRLFDKDGTFYNWWSANVSSKYNAKAQCFIDQYSSYKDPSTNKQVDGKLTLAENIADNGGLREAFRALGRNMERKSRTEREQTLERSGSSLECGNSSVDGGPRLPGLQQYTPEQMFFLGYATTWCNIGRSAQATNDNHAPNQVRVLASLSNMVEFGEAWSCPEGSPMNPENKCVLW